LEDLQHGNVLLPPDTNATGTLEVVPVHDDVDEQVDGDRHPLHGSHPDKLGVAKESGSTVVVGVEEGQWLLLEDKEDRVNELDIFVQVVELNAILLVSPIPNPTLGPLATYVVQNDQRLSPTTALVTDGVEDTVSRESGQELLNEQSQENTTDKSQDKVVDHEQGVELERRQLLHDLATTEDDNVVCDKHHGGLLQCGQRGHVLGELELAGRVAHDLLIGLVKEGPQVHTKWPVEGRVGHMLKDFGCHYDRNRLLIQPSRSATKRLLGTAVLLTIRLLTF
jgi:hypothetical protein